VRQAAATGLFAALRHQLAQTSPNWLAANRAAWENWWGMASRALPRHDLPQTAIVVRIQCIDDIMLHRGLLQLLSLETIQPLILFILPTASAVAILRGQALREGWASLVSLLTETELDDAIRRLPEDMPIALLPQPAPIPRAVIERISTSHAPVSLAARWTELGQMPQSAFLGTAGDYPGFASITAASLAGILVHIRELQEARLAEPSAAIDPTASDKPLRRDTARIDQGQDILVELTAVELSSVGRDDLLAVIVSTPGEKDQVTAIQSAGLAPVPRGLDIPLLPRHASDIERQMQIQLLDANGIRASHDLRFNVPATGIDPWMLTAFLNRGGGGNPVIKAFARGTGCRIAYAEDEKDVLRDVPVVWGVLRGSDRILAQARSQGLHFYYIDHAYFDRGHGKSYRITRNRYEAGKVRKVADDRLSLLGLDIQPWRSDGRSIIVCPPTDYFMTAHNCADWLDNTLATLRLETDRPIIVREKPKPGKSSVPLARALQTAHALVTHSSNVAIEAACLGTPVFVSPTSAAAPIGQTDFGLIETPCYPEREDWLAHLAYSQYSIDEIRDGTAWNLMGYLEDCEFV
jgi:hypothetical protein